MGTVGASSPFDPLDGVSGRLDMASEVGAAAVFSGLPPRRTEAVTTPFSPMLRREMWMRFNPVETWILFADNDASMQLLNSLAALMYS